MAPVLARPPFHREGWVYEETIDEWRMRGHRDGWLATLNANPLNQRGSLRRAVVPPHGRCRGAPAHVIEPREEMDQVVRVTISSATDVARATAPAETAYSRGPRG